MLKKVMKQLSSKNTVVIFFGREHKYNFVVILKYETDLQTKFLGMGCNTHFKPRIRNLKEFGRIKSLKSSKHWISGSTVIWRRVTAFGIFYHRVKCLSRSANTKFKTNPANNVVKIIKISIIGSCRYVGAIRRVGPACNNFYHRL